MRNEYELCYSHISGNAPGLYTEYLYGNVVPSDYMQLMSIFESNCMDDEAGEVKKDIEEYIDDEEVSED